MRRIHRPPVLAPHGDRDPYFDSVVLLLHGIGTDGGTTFEDSSRYKRTPQSVITTVTTTAENAKFGNSSLNFTGGRIYYADSDDFDVGGGDFTVESWAAFNSVGIGGRCTIFGQASPAGGQTVVGISKQTNNITTANLDVNGANVLLTGSSTWTLNVWRHVAVERFGNLVTLYIDGVAEASAAISTVFVNTSYKFAVGGSGEYANQTYGGTWGERMCGLLTEFRFTKGVARYRGNFEVPKTRFPDY